MNNKREKGYFVSNNEELNEIIKNSVSRIEILRKLNIKNPAGGGWYRIINNYFKLNNIDTSHLLGKGWSKNQKRIFKNQINDEDIFIKNSKHGHGHTVKRRYIKYIKSVGIDYECTICKIKEWQNKKISLHLDHINGNPSDNTIENLRLLCPNCHSQTETYCRCREKVKEKNKDFKNGRTDLNRHLLGSKPNSSSSWDTPVEITKTCIFCNKEYKCTNEKRKYCSNYCYCEFRKINKNINRMVFIKQRKVERPSKEILEKEIQENSFCALGRKYKVSDNAIRKWCKYYDIKLSKRKNKKHNLNFSIPLTGIEPVRY